MIPRLSRQTPAPSPGIVHLGLGAFSRAHLALYTDTAVGLSGGRWGIVGISLRSTGVRDELAEQDHVYTALQLNPDQATPRLVEVLDDVLVAPEDPGAVLARLTDPATRIVSLTITEKGYCLSRATGHLDRSHPDIVHDLTTALPVSAPGYIVRALQARQSAGTPPFTVLSCDNLAENGRMIRRAVLDMAEAIDPDLAGWIAANGRFPMTMVDRITPATKPEDLSRVADLIGAYDAAPVVHEPFSQWVVEDNFVAGARPRWDLAGAEMVADVRPFELMKLRMLNGTHSALAYLGYLGGFETIADCVADPAYRDFTGYLWLSEISPALSAPPGVSLADYADALLTRYENPGIRHLTWQIAMDGSQKLPQRILGTLADRLDQGGDCPGLILTLAAWMRYVSGRDEAGQPIDVRDPLAETFAQLARATTTPDAWVAALLARDDIIPAELAPRIAADVARTYRDLLDHGSRKMVARVLPAGSR